MRYVVYHKETTLFPTHIRNAGPWNSAEFASAAAAKSAITRAVNKGFINRDDYAIAEKTEFYSNIEKQKVCRNLMSNAPVTLGVNTPLCCDPSSETYWSM